MSFGLMRSRTPLEDGKPSITISASLFPNNDLLPLNTTLVLGFTPLLVTFTCKPDTLPASAVATFTAFVFVKSSLLMFSVEYASSFGLLLIPKAVTTTPSRTTESSLSFTLSFALLAEAS